MARGARQVEVVAEMVANVMTIGEGVVLLESMKMEIPVLTEHAGTVTAVKVAPGDVVQEGDVLVVLEPSAGT